MDSSLLVVGSKTFTIDSNGNSVTITTADKVTFSWTSTLPMDVVISKGGSNARLYSYEPEATSGSGLNSPLNGGGNVPAISHVSFCYDYEVSVSKTADTRFKRTHSWDVKKSVDQPSVLLSSGQSHLVNYTVDVSGSYVDSDFAVSGKVSVSNPDPVYIATVEKVEDILNGSPIELSCDVSFPYLLSPGASFECSYDASLASAASGSNTAAVTTSGRVKSNATTVSYNFSGAAIDKIDECFTLSDSLVDVVAVLGSDTLCTAKSFSYGYTISPDMLACGDNSIENTVALTTLDQGLVDSASASVNVSLACQQGCTLTQGYWKTHSKVGPAPYDNAWANIGALEEQTPFLISGMTYHKVLWTPPAGGNAYLQLAHQYIAAYLNTLNGASSAALGTSLSNAYTLLSGITPSTSLTKAQKTSMTQLAGFLDSYNNGAIGPGHCSE